MAYVERRGDKRWRARYRGPDGRERSKTFDRKSDAERFLAEIEVSKGRGSWVDPRMGRVTFGEFAALWLDQHHGTRHAPPRTSPPECGITTPI